MPNSISSRQELESLTFELNRILRDDCKLLQNGTLYFTKALVENIKGLTLNIYPNDHTPPHFHVIAHNPKIDCKINIYDISEYSGDIQNKYYDKIKAWYWDRDYKGREKLIEFWERFHGAK